MDNEVIKLCEVINSMPGLETIESCCGHGKNVFKIFFKINPDPTNEGLFFLTRCIDNRYWKYGDNWNIILTISDAFKNNLPILGILESTTMGKESYDEAEDLIENIKHHFNHSNFMKNYNIDSKRFNL